MAGRGSHLTWRAATVVGLLLATPSGAGMVPGGGSATSDCYAELDVAGLGADSVKRNKKVTCVDGDPCDSGPCGDGICDFKVRLCWNQDDPQLADCVPPPRLESLQLRGQLRGVLIMPDDLGGAACSGDYVDFPVATRGIRRAGRMNVRVSARAPEGTTPATDADWIRLVCMPRSFESCPMPTPTTTNVPATTIPGQTTTTTTTVTTTEPETTTTRKTTTTRRRRTTTTTTTFVSPTTRVPTTTTIVLPPTTVVIPTTLPTVTIPLPTTTTIVAATTTPARSTTTTTRRKRRGDDDDGEKDDLIGIDLPLV